MKRSFKNGREITSRARYTYPVKFEQQAEEEEKNKAIKEEPKNGLGGLVEKLKKWI